MSDLRLKSSSEPAPLVEVRELSVELQNRKVLTNVSFSFDGSEILGIVGGSGSGKTVLMRTVLGLVKPTSGQVRFRDHAGGISGIRVGTMFQQGALFSSLTAIQNIEFPLIESLKMDVQSAKEVAAFKLALVGLEPSVHNSMPWMLSGGMLKRVALARALATEPDLLFLDEPTAGLDPISAVAFDDLVLDLRSALSLNIILITHDLETLEALCGRVIVIGGGEILADGTLDAVRAVDHPWVRRYFRAARSRHVLSPPAAGAE